MTNIDTKKQQKFKEKDYYRQQIISLIDKIENTEYLFKIYHYVLAKYRRENERKEETGD